MSIWLDVTTILDWRRAAVGVVRVESECARHFLASDDERIRFCRFDPTRGGYSEVSDDEVLRAVRRITCGEEAESVGSLDVVAGDRLGATESRKRRGGARERLLRRLGLAAPGPSGTGREPAHPSAVDSSPSPRDSAAIEAIFQAGDVYVSMGLDWNQKDFKHLAALKRRVGFRVVLFGYDTIPVTHPHLCSGDVSSYYASYFTDLAWCADVVLCISECTRRDLSALLDELGAPIPDLRVVRLGTEVGAATTAARSQVLETLAGRPFLLFVSTLERRKNHEAIYRAYASLVDAGRRDLPQVVFVGMPGWGVTELLSDLELDPRVQGYFHLLHHVSDEDLAALYRGALFTVYPSLYEGWGLPVAESLAYGKFCLASNAASIPEVGGDLVEYVDPWDVPAWADRLAYYVDHPSELAAREARIRTSHRPPSWDETGAFVLACATSLLDIR